MITLITGSMFSGKTTTLVQKMERYIYAKKSVCLIRPKKDNRGYLTHSGGNDKVASLANEVLEISEFTNDIVNKAINLYDAVFVDEFFMIKNCKLLATSFSINGNCDVYFAGLIATSDNTLFEEAVNILPYCDDIIKLSGICVFCGNDGSYSMYVDNIKKNTIVVGDEDKYKCVCRKCYYKNKGKL